MNPDNINEMVNAIPLIMIYIVPGYIILRISYFQLSRKTHHDQYALAKSLLVSFVFVSMMEMLWKIVFPGTQPLTSHVFKNVVILASVAAGILCSRLITSSFFERMLIRLGIYRTLRTDIWGGVVDFEYGLWLMVYIPADRVVYAGKMRKYVENENSSSFVVFLSNYTLYDYNAEVLKDYVQFNDKWVALQSKDIGRLELFYHEKSSRIEH